MIGNAFPEHEARKQARSSLFVGAVMRTGEKQAPVKIRNMSVDGAMVEADSTPAIGAQVEVLRGKLCAKATIMWSADGRCGLRFASPVIVKDWLAPPAKAEQNRVDDIVAIIKSGKLPAASDRLFEAERQSAPRSNRELVEDLQAVAMLIQDLEEELVNSEETLARHGQKLQNLDIAAQMVRAICQALTSDDASSHAFASAKLRDLRLSSAHAFRKNDSL